MITLDSISVDGIKDVKKINLLMEKPYFYDVDLWIKSLYEEESLMLYSASISNPKGVEQKFEKSKNVSFIGNKIFIFNSDMNYETLFNSFSKLVSASQGRNQYESSILLQRYFEEQDVLFETSKEYYYYLFDKIKGKK
ncbi:hypothetical protein [Chitinophaga vietnamensis]|uniref:hypothetical protein n=1 Tax=Chitinophaga vietnamensis TaxID=2593957 RepID=UPI0011776390|nr:hypothetical protein [Chitinophaga vietnamensis]